MSARLSPQAVVHLVRVTDTQALLVSPQLDDLVAESASLFQAEEVKSKAPRFHQVPSFTEFLESDGTIGVDAPPGPWKHIDNSDRNVMILHSSGTTGKNDCSLPRTSMDSDGFQVFRNLFSILKRILLDMQPPTSLVLRMSRTH